MKWTTRLRNFLIKDKRNNIHMGNNNNKNHNAVSNNTAGNDSINTAQSPRTVTMKVDGNGNVIDNQQQQQGQATLKPSPQPALQPQQPQVQVRPQQAQAQPQQGTAGAQPTAGPTPNVEQNQNTGDGLSLPEGNQLGDINTDAIIEGAETEITSGNTEEEERAKKAELLTQAITSRYYFENINFQNSETGEQVGGSRIRYIADPYGKTIYDYMNNEAVNQHIGFKVPDDDPQDGSIVNRQITIYWKNPAF